MIEMLKIFLILVLILIIGFVLVIIKKQKQRKALLLLQKESQKITNQAFNFAIQHIDEIKLDDSTKVSSEFVSNVWGNRVAAFEYSIDVPGIETTELNLIKNELQQQLDIYAKSHQLKQYEQHPVFVVSDIWIFANVLHIDVSHITNQVTWAYIQDIEKSDRTK